MASCESKGAFFSVCLEVQFSSQGDADQWGAGQAGLNPTTEGGGKVAIQWLTFRAEEQAAGHCWHLPVMQGLVWTSDYQILK